MDLSDSEKRDLIKLIESNKPIPDQYRFRLFEKSDEIELLWNGKSNEITNVNLPFQIIEQVDEPRKEIQPSLQGNLFDERGRKLRGWTNKLIFPPYYFSIADSMVTNFHTPKSTLLMMISSFCGHDLMKKAYDEAIKEGYKFYSYGDAMLIL
jgi:hypothetical protein